MGLENATTSMYREGVDALVGLGRDFDDNAWQQTACGTWNALQTLHHVVAVVDWYQEWLARSLAGHVDAPFPRAEIDARNAANVARLAHLEPAVALDRYETGAGMFLERAQDHWNDPLGHPWGTITVADQVGLAATEWQLHAWDLAQSVGRHHRPVDPSGLFVIAGRSVAATRPAAQRIVLRALIPLGAHIRPWPTLLNRSGRSNSR